MDNNSRLKSLLELLNSDGNDGFLLFAVAKEYEKNELFDKALEYYEKLRSTDPNYVGLYYHLGALYHELDESEKAMEIYDLGIIIANEIKDMHALSELKGSKMNLELEL